MTDSAPLPSHHHYTYITIIALLVIATGFYELHNRSNEQYRKAMEETITTKFEQFGKSTQAQGHVVDYGEIAKIVQANMDPKLTAEIQRQNGTINNIAVALGEVKGVVAGLKPPSADTVRQADGSFNTTLEQNRGTLPPLTAVQLAYNAKDPNMKTALVGQWVPNDEMFNLKFVKWTGENGGFRSAAQLERTIKDHKSGSQIGSTETIPIVSSDSFFLKEDLQHVAPFPKYTFTLDTSIDLTKGYKGWEFTTTKWITRDWGTNVGYAVQGPNKQIKFGVSGNWGKHD